MTPSVDPVCGMQVAGDTGYAKMFRGTGYRFCSLVRPVARRKVRETPLEIPKRRYAAGK